MSTNNKVSIPICSKIYITPVQENVLKKMFDCQADDHFTFIDKSIPAVDVGITKGISTTSPAFQKNDQYVVKTSSGMNLNENKNTNVQENSKTNQISLEIPPEDKPLGSNVNSTSNISIKMAEIDNKDNNGNLYQNDSYTNLNTDFCRICMASGEESLISPCKCKGTLGSVHDTCLQRWLSASGRITCELCEGPYPVRVTQIYSFQRALVIWLGHFRLTFQTDCIFFCLVSIITMGLVACCCLGSRYMTIQTNRLGLSRDFTDTILDLTLAVVICGYIAFTYILWKNHYASWKRWRNSTVDVRLIKVDEPLTRIH